MKGGNLHGRGWTFDDVPARPGSPSDSAAPLPGRSRGWGSAGEVARSRPTASGATARAGLRRPSGSSGLSAARFETGAHGLVIAMTLRWGR
jgi:hypothetical protein